MDEEDGASEEEDSLEDERSSLLTEEDDSGAGSVSGSIEAESCTDATSSVPSR